MSRLILSTLAMASLAWLLPTGLFADPPAVPPGQAKKLTRTDYGKKEEKKREREERLAECEPKDSDTEEERQAKEAERNAILAEREAERQQEETQRKENPEDFAPRSTDTPLSAKDKKSSIHEEAVTAAEVIQKATTTVTRRTRAR